MKPFLFIVSIVLLSSCAKERLNGEVETLTGTWRTTHISGNDYGTHAPIVSTDENYFEIRFSQNGKVFLYNHEGNIIERGRIVSYSSHRSDNFPYSLFINVNIKSNQVLFPKLERINSIVVDGFYNEQTLRITDFTKDRGVDEFYFGR